MRKTLKVISVVMAALMLLGTLAMFSSCGEKLPEKKIVDHVYKYTEVPVSKELGEASTMCCAGDRFYSVFYKYNDDYSESTVTLYSSNFDGSDAKSVPLDLGDGWINYLCAAPDNNVWMLLNSGTWDEETQVYTEKFMLNLLDSDGKTISEIDIGTLLGLGRQGETGEYFYINSMESDTAGNVYFTNDKRIYAINPAGEIVMDYTLDDASDNTYINKITSYNGQVLVLYNVWGDTESKAYGITIDAVTKKVSEPVEFTGNIANNLYSTFGGNGAYALYYNDGKNIYGYDIESGETVELLSWINSDISSNGMNNIYPMSEDKFFCAGYDYESNEAKLAVLDKVAPEDIKPKYVISLAGVYVDDQVLKQVIKFNRANDEYRIEVKDYSVYSTQEDYSAGYTTLNNDIIAGKIPDILIPTTDMPLESYYNKGLFADLYAYMDKDESIKREDYLTNVLDAYSRNGKLYVICPSFSVMTLAAKTKNLNGITGWTMDEFCTFSENLPENTVMFYDMTRDNILSMFCYYAYDTFVNPTTGVCSFESESFKRILEYSNSLSKESIFDKMDWDDDNQDFWNDYQNIYRDDKAIVQNAYLSSFSDYTSLINYTFYDDITLVGVPVDDRNGAVIMGYGTNLAISAKTKFGDAAWNFVKSFIEDDYQENLNWYFPIKLSALEKKAEEEVKNDADRGDVGIYTERALLATSSSSAVEVVMTTDEAEKLAEDTDGGEKEPEFKQVRLTKEITDKLIAYLKTVNKTASYNTEVMDIITEEAEFYFGGQKTVDEAAALIQNRVQTLVFESR